MGAYTKIKTRKEAREIMMQTIFQMDAQKSFNIKDEFLQGKTVEKEHAYCRNLLENISTNITKIDQLIDESSNGWSIPRLAKTDLAILRLAITELLYFDDISGAITINEAVELAKKYGTDSSPNFINAVLGTAYSKINEK